MNQQEEDQLVNTLAMVLPTVDRDMIRKVIKEQASTVQKMDLRDFSQHLQEILQTLKEKPDGSPGTS